MGAARPPSLLLEAQERYEGARDRAKLAADEWEKAGKPIVVEHANRTLGLHPSFRAVEIAERHADRMREGVRAEERAGYRVPRVQPGRAGPLTELSPAAELRSIQGGKP